MTTQVEIHNGQLIGTLGRQQAGRQTVRNSSRLLSDMGPGTFFGSGSLLNGEGDLQVPSLLLEGCLVDASYQICKSHFVWQWQYACVAHNSLLDRGRFFAGNR